MSSKLLPIFRLYLLLPKSFSVSAAGTDNGQKKEAEAKKALMAEQAEEEKDGIAEDI